MARGRSKTKRLAKGALAVVAIVVGYDLYKAHTNGPAPTTNRNRIS